MQYFLDYGKELLIGNIFSTRLCLPLVVYLGAFCMTLSSVISLKDSRLINWFIQKLGPSKKIFLALLITFIVFILECLFKFENRTFEGITIFEDEASLFATCFGCTLLFISSLLLLYAKNIFTKLQWKKWISIPLFIVVQLIIIFFAIASISWENSFKYGDIKTRYGDSRLVSMKKYYDYEIIVNTEDLLFPKNGSPFTKKTSINLRVQGDSACLVGQDMLEALYSDKDTISAIPSAGVCKWFTKGSKEWEGVKNLAQKIRSYKQEYYTGFDPHYSQFTEVILLDYQNIRQKNLILPFAHERVPKASEILSATQFYIDSWEQFKSKILNNDKSNEETTSENKE